MTLVSTALVSVRAIRFFKGRCLTAAKFHVTVGHVTVMATATFFGPPREAADDGVDGMAADEQTAYKAAQQAKALALARRAWPDSFDRAAEYAHRDELEPASADEWAVIEFESPVPCALPSVAIASHLDADASGSACRLAFHGRMLAAISADEMRELRIFKSKVKEGQVERVHDETTVICKNLFKPGTDMNLFVGMSVQLGGSGPIGRIEGTFGKSKFKCVFPPNEKGLAGLQEACHKQ